MPPDSLLTNLNSSQRAAVSSLADTLAILAGPGSGKTHTLTSRTAWLLAQGLEPWNVIVATFTVKAAREMKERIGKLIGNGLESKLILGTFHSIARRYLARYGHLIDIPKDFGIADSADSLAIIKRIIKRHEFMLDPRAARSRISSQKAKGLGYNDDRLPKKLPAKSVEAQEFETCYTEYEEALQRSNLLDYDDLLLRCVDLLRKHPSCVSNVEAVLIDEFQDTNIVQFDLMRLFASARKRITIVGDPDQSIYGFRAAETENYKRLLRQYPDTVTIALEENYRSSGAILLTALNVIEQDISRVAKTLMPTHTIGTRPVLRKLSNAHMEAEWIITEIQRCIGSTGDLLGLYDIAVLLRSASLSRLIESALGKAGISYRMVGGLRFYDRVEVKTMLDYLRVISQPDNNDALSRIINTPSRRIGDATVKGLLEEADQSKITLWALILGAVQGRCIPKTKLTKATEKGISEFVNIILSARRKATDSEHSMNIVELINFVCKKTSYENWLKDHHADVTGARWENVQELITQARDFQGLVKAGSEDESLPNIAGVEQNEGSEYLSRFLANVALASEVKEEDGGTTPQVTISTIHAAKGLEWPVVFIPALYEGSIPHSRSDDTDEERRLLYVAMTRAKTLLYMSVPLKSSQGEQTVLSPFLSHISLAPLLDSRGPSFPSLTIQSIAQILRRPLPSSELLRKAAANLHNTEDDLYPINEENEDPGDGSGYSTLLNISYARGQMPTKRRRVEFGRSISDIEQESREGPTLPPITSVSRASSFTVASLSQKTAFISGGSLLALNEQSINRAVGFKTAQRAKSDSKSKETGFGAQKCKDLNSQGTLLGFLGKTDHRQLNRTDPSIECPEASKDPGRAALTRRFTAQGFHRPDTFVSMPETVYIAPALASHRIGTGKATRPKAGMRVEEHRRNDYVFLSSSPPRPSSPKKPETVPDKPTGLSAKSTLMPLLRPAASMHTTTISTLQGGGPKKTLGVKRSMTGWPGQKGNAFVPPTIKRPG